MKILFQGDSITDAGRDRNDFHDMGQGYAKFASAMIADSFPDTEIEFINLGISGNRSDNLLARTERDIVDIQPDIVSILLGVNDVWHRTPPDVKMNITDEQFEENYRAVLERIRKGTNAKLLMIEPFLLYAPDKEYMREEIDRIRAIVRKLAEEYADVYLPMGEIFTTALPSAPQPDFYSADGVHPNADGACFLAEHYLHAISPLIEAAERN